MRKFWQGWLGGRAAGMSEAAVLRALCVMETQNYCQSVLAQARYQDPRRLLRHGYKVHSQTDEDGILQEIFRRIGTTNRRLVELGVGNGLENNTLFLLLQGWGGLWIEGDARKAAFIRRKLAPLIAHGTLAVDQQVISATNADACIAAHGAEGEIDLLSIDLDGNDYHVLKAIGSVSPRVVVAEYNAKFPPQVAWVMAQNERHRWDGSDYFGASLQSLAQMMDARGYKLVGCNITGVNAFFVRADQVNEERFCPPFTAENHYEPPRYFLLAGFSAGHRANFGPFEPIAARERPGKE
jgi:hypothetical protein